MLGHAAADDEQVGAEEELDVAVVPLQPLGPLLPAESPRAPSPSTRRTPRRPCRASRAARGRARSSGSGRRCRSCAEPMPVPSVVRIVSPGLALARRRSAFRRRRDVGVVGEVDVATEPVLEELLRLEADPLLRDVRRRQRAAALHDRGERDAERDRVVARRRASRAPRVTAASTSCGSAPAGVATLIRSLRSVPASRSTIPALMPVPPMSTPTARVACRCHALSLSRRAPWRDQ